MVSVTGQATAVTSPTALTAQPPPADLPVAFVTMAPAAGETIPTTITSSSLQSYTDPTPSPIPVVGALPPVAADVHLITTIQRLLSLNLNPKDIAQILSAQPPLSHSVDIPSSIMVPLAAHHSVAQPNLAAGAQPLPAAGAQPNPAAGAQPYPAANQALTFNLAHNPLQISAYEYANPTDRENLAHFCNNNSAQPPSTLSVHFPTYIMAQTHHGPLSSIPSPNLLPTHSPSSHLAQNPSGLYTAATTAPHTTNFMAQTPMGTTHVDPNPSILPISLFLSSLPNSNHMSTKLNSENYLLWKSQFENLLGSHSVLGYIDGSITCPSTHALNSLGQIVPNPSYSSWVRTDSSIKTWMHNTMSQEILLSVYSLPTSQAIWQALETRFIQQSLAKQLQYKREFSTIQKCSLSCDAYLTKIQQLANNLQAVKSPVSSTDLVLQTLNGLPPEYDSFVTSITMHSSIITFDDLRARLLQFEHRLLHLQSTPPTPAFIATSNYSRGRGRVFSRGRGHGSGRGRGRHGRGHPPSASSQHGSASSSRFLSGPPHSSGHTQDTPPGLLPPSRTGQTCQLCSTPGHASASCPHRFDHSYVSEDLPKSFSAITVGDTPDLTWFPDSGASAHMTPYNGQGQRSSPPDVPFI